MTEIFCENCDCLMELNYQTGQYECKCCGNSTIIDSKNKDPSYIG